jgi:hypothetical protein
MQLLCYCSTSLPAKKMCSTSLPAKNASNSVRSSTLSYRRRRPPPTYITITDHRPPTATNNDNQDSGDSSHPSITIQSIDFGSTSDGEQ